MPARSQPDDLERERADTGHGRRYSIALLDRLGREHHLAVSARPGNRCHRGQRSAGSRPRDGDARHRVARFVAYTNRQERVRTGDDADRIRARLHNRDRRTRGSRRQQRRRCHALGSLAGCTTAEANAPSKARVVYGEAQKIGNGTARIFATLDADKQPTSIGVSLSEDAIVNLPMTPVSPSPSAVTLTLAYPDHYTIR